MKTFEPQSFDEQSTILFISVIRTPNSANATSTHIMTNNLLRGLKENHKKIVFLAICEYGEEIDDIKDYYREYTENVIVLKSFFGHDIGKYKQLFKIVSGTLFRRKYKTEIEEKLSRKDEPALIITHSPSFESAFYGELLKKAYPTALFYEYWSDPVTLSGITPEKTSYKRLPFKWAEYKALKQADRIIYGTKTLMQFQKNLFPTLASKMSYIDVAYTPHGKLERKLERYSNRLLYAGNYFSNLRNLQPLAEAVSKNPNLYLDVYGAGDCDIHAPNIVYHGRVSPEDLAEIEVRYEITACILNHSCIQIPGKVFYMMDTDMKILVITDGPHEDEILSYLREFQRFTICKNSVQDIAEALDTIVGTASDYAYARFTYAPGKVAGDLLNGGLIAR